HEDGHEAVIESLAAGRKPVTRADGQSGDGHARPRDHARPAGFEERRHWLLPVEKQRAAAAFAVIRDDIYFFWRPVLELKVMRDDAGSFFELAVEQGLHLVIDGIWHEIDSDEIGRAVVLLEEVAINNVRGLFQLEVLNALRALFEESVIEFDA